MKTEFYKPDEYRQWADFIKEMLRALKKKNEEKRK